MTDTVPPGESIFSVANRNVALIVQVESRAGVENVEAITRHKGVDMVMVGGQWPFPSFALALLVI